MQLQTTAALKPEMNLNQPLNVFGLGLLLPLLIYSVLRVIPGANRHFHQTTEHFYIVSLTAICAAGIAVFIGLKDSSVQYIAGAPFHLIELITIHATEPRSVA